MTGLRTLQIEQVEIGYAPGRPAVAGVSLEFGCGSITALLGPSGSGKSTLLRAIAGLERVQAGEIRFAGELWSAPDAHRAPEERRCGVVFQDYALFPHLTALDNVAFGLSGPGRKSDAMAKLEAVELGARARAYPHELSGGEQQRVALARALTPEPDVMLLDEPFSGLDRRLRGALREASANALREAGAATLIVTHDAEEAMALADTIALMAEGRIIQTGDAQSLYLNPASEAAARLLGEVERFDATVTDGQAQTPFGEVGAPGLSEGAECAVLIRPEGVQITDGADGALAHVLERRITSGGAVLTLSLESGERVRATTPITAAHGAGDSVRLRLDTRFATVVAV
ncbi:MAG: ABC transporter ATP-binding protein [Pseudomonadota bacterium]